MEIDKLSAVAALPAMLAEPNLSPQQQVEQRQLIRAVRALNRAEWFGFRSELTFTVDDQTKRPVLRIVDRETREVLQQIPPEYVLRLAEEVRER